MTKKEFKEHYFQNMYDELCFLYYSEFVGLCNKHGISSWHTTEHFINHGRSFKRQWHEHMYNLRRIDYSTLSYK